MELKNVTWEDGQPQEATFSMSVREAAMIASLFGKFSPRMVAEFFGDSFVESNEKINEGLWDQFFVRHFDEGYHEVLHPTTRNMGFVITNGANQFFINKEGRWTKMAEFVDDTRPGD